ncbi:MAG: hypothetical protein SGILL_003955 [Bacillariaceae sp.]
MELQAMAEFMASNWESDSDEEAGSSACQTWADIVKGEGGNDETRQDCPQLVTPASSPDKSAMSQRDGPDSPQLMTPSPRRLFTSSMATLSYADILKRNL